MYYHFSRFLGQGTDLKEVAPSISTIVAVQAAGGIIAGASASCITTPLDTIKTRLQVFLGPCWLAFHCIFLLLCADCYISFFLSLHCGLDHSFFSFGVTPFDNLCGISYLSNCRPLFLKVEILYLLQWELNDYCIFFSFFKIRMVIFSIHCIFQCCYFFLFN